jgi:hypothetical protein
MDRERRNEPVSGAMTSLVGLGFVLARAAIMADDARVDLAQARRLAKVARLRAEWKADSGRSDLR